jgi:hypothetical protein
VVVDQVVKNTPENGFVKKCGKDHVQQKEKQYASLKTVQPQKAQRVKIVKQVYQVPDGKVQETDFHNPLVEPHGDGCFWETVIIHGNPDDQQQYKKAKYMKYLFNKFLTAKNTEIDFLPYFEKPGGHPVSCLCQ